MAKLNLGRVAFVLRGEWVQGTYSKLDVVSYVETGDSYVSRVDNNMALPTDDTKWLQLTNVGDSVEAANQAAQAANTAAESATAAAASGVRTDTDQGLNDTQKSTARGNIDAASVGEVSDLKSAIDDVKSELTADDAIKSNMINGNLYARTTISDVLSPSAYSYRTGSAKLAFVSSQTSCAIEIPLADIPDDVEYFYWKYDPEVNESIDPVVVTDNNVSGANVVGYFSDNEIPNLSASFVTYGGAYDSNTKIARLSFSEIKTRKPTGNYVILAVAKGVTAYADIAEPQKTLEWLTVSEENLDENLKEAIFDDYVVQDYFKEEVEDTAEKILALSANPCVVLSFITDTHEREGNAESVRITNEMFENVTAVNRAVTIDGIVHGGDFLYPDNVTENPDWATVNKHLMKFVKKFEKANQYAYMVTGNHDGNGGTRPNQNETYQSLQKFNERYVVRQGNAPYFFWDYTKEKVRIIVLSTSNYNATYTIRHGLEPEEYAWLRDDALNVDNGWAIVIFAHIQPYSTSVDWVNKDNFIGLCNAFNDHTTFTDSQGVTSDFSGKTSKIVAYIAGHGHYDMVISDNTYVSSYNLTFPIILTGCSQVATPTPPSGATTPSRTAKTVTQDLWDVFIYRGDLNKIYAVRFGAGDDREIPVPAIT